MKQISYEQIIWSIVKFYLLKFEIKLKNWIFVFDFIWLCQKGWKFLGFSKDLGIFRYSSHKSKAWYLSERPAFYFCPLFA